MLVNIEEFKKKLDVYIDPYEIPGAMQALYDAAIYLDCPLIEIDFVKCEECEWSNGECSVGERYQGGCTFGERRE